MIRDITPTIDPMDRNPFFLELRFTPQKIFLLPAPPERIHMRMLQQQQRRRALPLSDLCRVLVLQLPGLFVFDQAQIKNFEIILKHATSPNSPTHLAPRVYTNLPELDSYRSPG